MIVYVHQVPGRLRVRISRLKQSPAEARRLTGLLERHAGVLSVETNLVTGSLLVHFDPGAARAEVILDLLERSGHRRQVETLPVPRRKPASPSLAPARLGEEIVGAVLQKVLERGAVALVAALV